MLPIDGSAVQRLMTERPQITEDADQLHVLARHPGACPSAVAPRVLNRPHSITADVEIPAGGAEGVLLCQGANTGGCVVLRQGRPAALRPQLRRAGPSTASSSRRARARGPARSCASSSSPPASRTSPSGKGAPGRAQLYIDGHLVGETDIPVTTPITFNPGGLTCGANPGSPVTPDYQSPFRFTGTLHSVTVDLSGDLIVDTESEMRVALARQ